MSLVICHTYFLPEMEELVGGKAKIDVFLSNIAQTGKRRYRYNGLLNDNESLIKYSRDMRMKLFHQEEYIIIFEIRITICKEMKKIYSKITRGIFLGIVLKPPWWIRVLISIIKLKPQRLVNLFNQKLKSYYVYFSYYYRIERKKESKGKLGKLVNLIIQRIGLRSEIKLMLESKFIILCISPLYAMVPLLEYCLPFIDQHSSDSSPPTSLITFNIFSSLLLLSSSSLPVFSCLSIIISHNYFKLSKLCLVRPLNPNINLEIKKLNHLIFQSSFVLQSFLVIPVYTFIHTPESQNVFLFLFSLFFLLFHISDSSFVLISSWLEIIIKYQIERSFIPLMGCSSKIFQGLTRDPPIAVVQPTGRRPTESGSEAQVIPGYTLAAWLNPHWNSRNSTFTILWDK
ncbi:hypothetical protein VP01_2988g1 [Puccinia sorghi]|uniref:Uncharacterized protein n=1 Tax=Puccinia sorghi TaxID=27349 RepID=A0A0L6V0G3_9BASI|nr:hypothetical protein VP01_2988g1 [Puccinia sorghi]